MKISVNNAVSIIVSLFSEEEKESLAIELAGKKFTLEEQLLARYLRTSPLYNSTFEFTLKAAQIKDHYFYLFKQLIEYGKTEWRESLMEKINNPESYIPKRYASGDSDAEGKNISRSNHGSIGTSSASTKIRGAASSGGQEGKEIDKVWEKEDNKFLNSTPNIIGNINNGVNFKEGKRLIDKISIISEQSPTVSTDLKIFLDPEEDTLEQGKDLTFHSTSTTQNRTKGINLNKSNIFSAGEYDRHKKFENKILTGSEIGSYSLWMRLDLPNIRDFALGKFDPLFKLSRCR